MKIFLIFIALGLSACGSDDPSEGANNTNGTTNNMTVAANNMVNNTSNNQATNNTVNNLNNPTNNSTSPADMGMDLSTSDMGTDLSTSDMGMDLPDSGADVGVDATVDVGPAPDGELCATAIPIAAGQTIDNQTTTGASDDYEAKLGSQGCPNNSASGPDRVYVLNSAVAGNFRVVVVPEATFDPALYVRLDCALPACVDGTVLNGAGVQESVTISAAANTDYFIIVDGELFDDGAYSISVQAL